MSQNFSEQFNKLYPEFHFTKLVSTSYSWNLNASDEVNTLLNYGYAIPESQVWKDINSVDLDPTVAFCMNSQLPKRHWSMTFRNCLGGWLTFLFCKYLKKRI